MITTSASKATFQILNLVNSKNVEDCPGMMDHILHCLIALSNRLQETKKSSLQASTNLVFKEAVLFVINGFFDDTKYINLLELDSAASTNESKRDVWFPLYWAVLIHETVGNDVVKTIYNSSPSALTKSYYNCGIYFQSPVHLLCTSELFTTQQNELVDFFISKKPNSFQINDGFGALHILAFHCKNMIFLRTIIQLAPNEVSTKCRAISESALDIMMRQRFLE